MADVRTVVTAGGRQGPGAAVVRSVVAGLLTVPYAVLAIMASLSVGRSSDPAYAAWTEAVFAATMIADTLLLMLVCIVNGRPVVQRSAMHAGAAGAVCATAVGVAALGLVALVAATVVSPESNVLPLGSVGVTTPVLVLAWLSWRSARRCRSVVGEQHSEPGGHVRALHLAHLRIVMTGVPAVRRSGALARGLVAGLLMVVYALTGIILLLTLGTAAEGEPYRPWVGGVLGGTAAVGALLLMALSVVNLRPMVQKGGINLRAAQVVLTTSIALEAVVMVLLLVAVVTAPSSAIVVVAAAVLGAVVLVIALLSSRAGRATVAA